MKGFVLGLAVEGRKLWRRLSVAQRAALVGITAAAALGLTLMALDARAAGDRDATRRGVGFELGAARNADEPETATGEREEGGWIFEGDGLFGNSLHRLRHEESQRRRVRKAICWNASIRSAEVEIERPVKSLLRTRETDGSATVALCLEPGVQRLSARAARVAREIVCGAFGLPPDVVTLTDNMGNSYPALEDAVWEDEGDERYRSSLENDIRELVSGLFAEEEFNLVVRAYEPQLEAPRYPTARSKVGGLMVPGGDETIVLPSHRNASDGPEAASRDDDDVHECGVNVVATFDLGAVRRLLGDEDGPFRTIEEFVARQTQVIENLVFPQPCRLSVSVQPLTRADSIAEVSDAESNEAASGVSASSVSWGLWRDQLERHWPIVAVGGSVLGLALIGCVVLSKRRTLRGRAARLAAQRSSRRKGEKPPASTRWRAFSGRAAIDDLSGTNGDSLLSATERMSEWVRERPQTTASVLRVWLAQSTQVAAADAPGDGGTS